jgi:hypothetical protein
MNIEILSTYIANLPLLRGQAYLDPGSGSFLLQLLIAGLLGLGLAIKMSWRKIRALFGYKDSQPEDDQTETGEADDTDQPG